MKNSNEQVPDPSLDEDLQLQPISGPVLGWLPGETLYSLVSRNHFYRGHKEHSHTLEAFFGTLSGIDLQRRMSELEVFEARTGGRLGSGQDAGHDSRGGAKSHRQTPRCHNSCRFFRI